MNNNLLAGLVIAAVVILGGIALFVYSPGTSSPTATTTTQTNTDTTNTTTTTTTTTQPSAPLVTNATVTEVSKSTAIVTGRVTPNGARTSYWYEYGRTNTLGSRTTSQSIGSGYTAIATPAVINNLLANTQYYFRLNASNSAGASLSQISTFTTNNVTPPPAPSAPVLRTSAVSAISRTTAVLNGQVTPNGSETSYWFEFGETNDLGNVTTFQSAGSGTIAQAISVGLSGLKPSTKYFFQLNAQNQYGTVNGPTLNFVTSGPAAVSAPTVITRAASAVASTTATLHGTVDPHGALTTYWFEYSSDSLLGSVLIRATPQISLNADAVSTSVMADVSGLSTSTTYYYRIVANNSEGTVRGDRKSFNTK